MEIEKSALVRQSLKRRLGSAESVARELDATVEERNQLEKKIHWAFSTEQARDKQARI